MRSRKWLPAVLAVLVIAVGAGGGLAAAKLAGRRTQAGIAVTEPDYDNGSEELGGTVVRNGRTYKLNHDLQTVLLLGVDYGSDRLSDGNVGTAGRADSILLLILDNADKTTSLLSISRDTITEVDVYDDKGNFSYSGPMHLNMQYAYGDSPRRSCFLQKRTVSELLYGLRIDGCLAFTLEGFSAVINELGGLDLTFDKDYSRIDARYAEGASLHLSGDEVERFIRWRDTETLGSNDDRMDRQTWVARQMFRQMSGKVGVNRLEDIIDTAENHIESDLDAETLKKLISYPIAEEAYKLPGEDAAGELHDEFHVDEEGLKALLLQLFYVEQ